MKKFIQIIKGFFAKPNVMFSFLRAKIKHKEKEEYKTDYEKEIFYAQSNIRANEAHIKSLIHDRDVRMPKQLNDEIKRYEDGNELLRKWIIQFGHKKFQQEAEEKEPMVCACWSCQYALSKGWFPATLTKEQNNEVRKYGMEIGFL